MGGRGRGIVISWPRSSATTAFILAVALAALTTAVLFVVLPTPFAGVDDANIYLAYAHNLAAGDGFVYNAGGEAVEGFTSLLWLLVCTLAVIVTTHPELALLFVNVLLVGLTIAAVVVFVHRDLCALEDVGRPLSAGTWHQWALFLWIFASPGYVIWSTAALMDTALWGFVYTLGTIAAARSLGSERVEAGPKGRGLSVMVALALLTRPEAMLIAAAWILARLAALVVLWRDWRRALRWSMLPAGSYVCTLAGLTLFRLLYFGYPLPNTFYAKVSPSLTYDVIEGGKYLVRFVLDHALVALPLAIAVLVAFEFVLEGRRRGVAARHGADRHEMLWRGKMFVVGMSLLVALLAHVLTGGDHFPLSRFYQPIWPMLAVPLLGYIAHATRAGLSVPAYERVGRAKAALIVLAVVTTVYASHVPRWDQVLRRPDESPLWEFSIAVNGRRLGEALNNLNVGSSPLSVGVFTAGGVAVTYDGPIVDLMGLNNVRMAHSSGERRGIKGHAAFDHEVFFQLAPDLVVPLHPEVLSEGLQPREGTSQFEYTITRGIYYTERYRELYEPVIIRLPEEASLGAIQQIATWGKREVVDELREWGFDLVSPPVGGTGAR